MIAKADDIAFLFMGCRQSSLVTIPIATGFLPVMIAAVVRKPTTAVSFGAVVEMSLVLTLAAWAGLVSSRLFAKIWPYVNFGILAFAAVITPQMLYLGLYWRCQ